MTRQPAKRRTRSGYVLVLFAMMMFVFLGIAALVIDLGYTRLTRLQMQTAVDNAALEGLRWQSGGAPLGSARQQASSDVAYLFDDDMNPINGDTNNFGAGPIVQLQGGNDEERSASQQIVIPATHVYKPTRSDGTPGLELNSANLTNGDLVAGNYGLNSSFQESAGTTGLWSDENDDYTRDDFVLSTTGSAFLARMRRTPLWDVVGSMDNSSSASSAGPTLPYLWGRGTMLQSSPTTLDQGITVRATAIAAVGPIIGLTGTNSTASYEAGRAKIIGPPYSGTDANNNPINILGITPFSISAGTWNTLPAGVAKAFQVSSLTTGIQWFGTSPTTTIQIGQSLSVISATPMAFGASSNTAASASNYGYVPIYTTYMGTDGIAYNVIIGFGYIGWNWDGRTLSLTMFGTNHIASSNASAVLGSAFVVLTDTNGNPVVDPNALFHDHATLFSNGLYSPVLVNHYIGPYTNN